MSHDHNVDNCSFRFCRKCRQLNLRENRSLTQYYQGNPLPASHRFMKNDSVLACSWSLVVIVMVVAMVMVMVAAIVSVPARGGRT